MEKYKIEKDSVQETLIIPLYGRRLCSQRFPGLYQDSTAAMLMEKVDYDFSPLERQANSLMQTFGALEVAMRQNDLAWEVRDYLNAHPRAAVINLGCGLDNTGRACDNGRENGCPAHAENLGKAGGHPGCGRLFFCQGRQGGAGALVAAFFCFQPGLYAGLSIAS